MLLDGDGIKKDTLSLSLSFSITGENFSGGNVTWKNLGISQTITHEFYFPRQTATVSLHFPPMARSYIPFSKRIAFA